MIKSSNDGSGSWHCHAGGMVERNFGWSDSSEVLILWPMTMLMTRILATPQRAQPAPRAPWPAGQPASQPDPTAGTPVSLTDGTTPKTSENLAHKLPCRT